MEAIIWVPWIKSFRESSKTGKKLVNFISFISKTNVDKTIIAVIITNIKLHRAITSIPFRTAQAQIKVTIIRITTMGVSGII
jgi:hypothetical protein